MVGAHFSAQFVSEATHTKAHKFASERLLQQRAPDTNCAPLPWRCSNIVDLGADAFSSSSSKDRDIFILCTDRTLEQEELIENICR